MTEKVGIRQAVLKKRDGLDIQTRLAKDSLIKEKLFSLPEFQKAGIIFYFASFRSEVNTLSQIKEALALNKRVVLPRVANLDDKTKGLKLYEIKGMTDVSPGCMGILEPTPVEENLRDINDVDFVVMPGVAFDYRCNRLGYGAGYYDKLLARLKKQIPLVAIAYDEQMVETVPVEPHDIKIHKIITDKRNIACGPD